MLQKMFSFFDVDGGWYKYCIWCIDAVILIIGSLYGIFGGAALGAALSAIIGIEGAVLVIVFSVICGILGFSLALIPAYIFHRFAILFDDFLGHICTALRF